MIESIPTISKENFENEFRKFYSYVQECGLSENLPEKEMYTLLEKASCGLSEDTGVAYFGALVCHINLLIAVATKEAKLVSTTLPVDYNSLLKVCLLQHISKAEMFIPQDNDYFIKRGDFFKFANLEGRLKGGERSVIFGINHGISFTPIECEAMLCLDREIDSKAGRQYDSSLSLIVRISNEIAYALERNKK